jgi:DNA polymerase-1
MAINAPMQGTQADIVKLAMVQIDELFSTQGGSASGGKKEKSDLPRGKAGAYLLLQVHDELVFEIKDNKVKDLAPKIKEIMEEVVPEKDRKGIPFVAEGKAGENWGEMKKI